MSDQLIELLSERFHGHEMDVPPGAWEQVTEQMAASSGEELRESLQDKFQGHEMQVDPSAWANINAQIGQGVAAGTSIYTGWIAAGVAAVVLTAALFLWNNKEAGPIASVLEVPPVSLIEIPATESKPIAVNPEPIVEESAQKAAPAEVGPVRAAVPKTTTQVEANEVTTTQKASPRTDAAENVVPERQQEPLVQEPVKQPIAPITLDPQVGHESGQEHTPASPENGSSSTPLTETRVEPTGPSTSGVETEQPSVVDPFQSDHTNDILIPNAFSPQGDGVNDKLKIVAGEYEKVDVRVFAAKTGSLVFRSNDLSNMWDGRLPNGNIAEEGYYSCMVLVTDKNGQTRVKSMVVQLFR